jgi:glutamyl-tRNA reductase
VLLERADVEHVVNRRDGRPLLIVDVAVPRDIAPDIAALPGVTVFDIDDLHRVVDSWTEQRATELDDARAIVEDELMRFLNERQARSVAPVISSWHERMRALHIAELDRHRSRLNALDDEARAAVDAIVHGVVNKLLHEPTIRLKDAAGTARGEALVDAIIELFDLESETNEP